MPYATAAPATATEKTIKWYNTLRERVQDLGRRYELPEDITAEVQNLMFEVAREQFKIGSKSGAAWAFKKRDTEAAVPRA